MSTPKTCMNVTVREESLSRGLRAFALGCSLCMRSVPSLGCGQRYPRLMWCRELREFARQSQGVLMAGIQADALCGGLSWL